MKRIRELRDEYHISQLQVALKLGVSQETVSSYETGKSYPTVERLIILSEYFHVSTDYLLGRSDIRRPKIETLTRLDTYEQELIQNANLILDSKKKELLLDLSKALSD